MQQWRYESCPGTRRQKQIRDLSALPDVSTNKLIVGKNKRTFLCMYLYHVCANNFQCVNSCIFSRGQPAFKNVSKIKYNLQNETQRIHSSNAHYIYFLTLKVVLDRIIYCTFSFSFGSFLLVLSRVIKKDRLGTPQ